MLILRVLRNQPLHGYAIAQRIRVLSNEQLSVEEGSLYPALQKLLMKGLVKAAVDNFGIRPRSSRVPDHGGGYPAT
jgi:DNA-binding PadR family transcriptional regulator